MTIQSTNQNCWTANINTALRKWMALRRLLSYQSLLRLIELHLEERKRVKNYEQQKPFRAKRALQVFNLDLHIAVNADLQRGLASIGIQTSTWSISMHNHLISGRRPVPDPVAIVNARTWRDLSPERVVAFRERYKSFLESFDGFLVTYPPAFAQLFAGLDKPVLVVAATRYEAPYTQNSHRWQQLDRFLVEGIETRSILMVANNRGDADYFRFFTGSAIPTVPSLCVAGDLRWRGGNGQRIIVGRDSRLVQTIEAATNHTFVSVDELGTPYAWEDLLLCEEVCVLPQNISTMTLFRLATAGVPVAVPSKSLIASLRPQYPSLLGELTFAQIEGRDNTQLRHDDPTNFTSSSYLDWWLDRADFYDHELMPNVRVFESFADLRDGDSSFKNRSDFYWQDIIERNNRVFKMNSDLVNEFKSLLRAGAAG